MPAKFAGLKRSIRLLRVGDIDHPPLTATPIGPVNCPLPDPALPKEVKVPAKFAGLKRSIRLLLVSAT